MTFFKGGAAAFRIFNRKTGFVATTQNIKLRIHANGVRRRGEAVVIVNHADLKALQARLYGEKKSIFERLSEVAVISSTAVQAALEHGPKKAALMFLERYRWKDQSQDLSPVIDKIASVERLIAKLISDKETEEGANMEKMKKEEELKMEKKNVDTDSDSGSNSSDGD